MCEEAGANTQTGLDQNNSLDCYLERDTSRSTEKAEKYYECAKIVHEFAEKNGSLNLEEFNKLFIYHLILKMKILRSVSKQHKN